MMGQRIGFFVVKIVTAFCMAFCCLSAWAQRGVSVKMNLSDSKTGEAVGFATVSLTVQGEDKPYKYVVSASNGNAEFTGVRDGKYLLRAELLGYKNYEQSIEVAGEELSLGKIKMHPDAQRLNAATVTDIGNPIIVKKDTIEYNASSFKTTDNDMLEDLLKKLPGVEVGTDGSVTANGETISKITIDGKTFFLDDPQLATKNIPAKIVEKVKVVEKKSDQAIFTGIDDGEEETVIDLSIQKGMMNGWFGNIMGGGGHDMPDKGIYKNDPETSWKNDGWRYQGAAMVGRFTDASQLSLILNGNNTNNRGFNDLAGNMMQNMRGGRGMGRGTGGWGANNGITSSWMTGLNGAFTLLDGDMDLGGNYVYNGSDKYIEEDSRKTTYLDDGSSLIYDSKGTNMTSSQGHRFGVRLEHYFTEKTSILFEPQVNFGSGYFHEYSDFTTYTDPGTGAPQETTNTGFTENKGWNNNWSTSGFLLFRQRLGKPGRTISLNVRYDFSGNKLNGYNQSYTDNDTEAEGDEEIVNQRYNSVSNSSSIELRAVYTEPIATNFFLELNYSYSWNQNKSTKDTYDSSDNAMGKDDDDRTHLTYSSSGEEPNPYYSNYITNKFQNHNAGADFIYQKDKFRAQLGAAFRPTVTDNTTYVASEDGERTYHSSVMNWSPQAMVSYDFGDNSNVRLFYFGRSEQPSTSQLMPVADNSDPLNISFGNPYLEPYFTHRLRGRFAYTNKETFTSVHASLGGSLVQNTVTNAMWYDSNGTQYAMPLNGKNSGNVDLRVMVNSPFARSKFSIFNMTYFSYSNSTSYVGKTEGGMGDDLINRYFNAEEGTLDYEKFHNDFFGHDVPESERLNFHDYFTDSKTETFSFTERLRFTYRSDLVEVNVGGRTRMSKSWYSITEYNQSANWDNQVELSMNWTIPGGVGLMAEGRYNWYNGYTTKQDDEIIFNAEISKLLFKNRFTLALKAYDIFNQSKNLHVTDESNYHQETKNNTLGRYIMLSLTFRFGKFNGNGNMRRGPGGPGGPGGGRPPMGGGPGPR